MKSATAALAMAISTAAAAAALYIILFLFIIFGQDSSNPFCFADQPLFGISSLSGYRPSHSLCSPKMENDTVGYFDSFFDGEGLAHLLDSQGDIYIITMLDWKSVPRACPAPTMEDWKAFYATELEVIQKFESDKKKIVDALQAAMGKTFITDLFGWLSATMVPSTIRSRVSCHVRSGKNARSC